MLPSTNSMETKAILIKKCICQNHMQVTVGFQTLEIGKKVLHSFDNIFHVYMVNGLQKYIKKKFTMAFRDILIFNLRFIFYPTNVLNKVQSHMKVKITVVCHWNFDFKLDYKQYAKKTHVFLQILLEPTFWNMEQMNSMETKQFGYRFLSVKITASCLRIWFADIRL